MRRRGLDAWLRAAYRIAFRLQLALWRVTRPTIHGVHVAVWHAGRVLVIQNSYRRSYSFPAGRIKRSEVPSVAAARELEEEVGIAVRPDTLRDVGEMVDVTVYAEDRARVFELHCEDEPSIRVDGREVVMARFLEPEQALELDLIAVSRRYLLGRGAG